MNDDCTTCKHSKYDHITWKAGTKYANNNMYCRIVRCNCSGFMTAAVDYYDE